MLSVLELGVACFEYKVQYIINNFLSSPPPPPPLQGKRNLSSTMSNVAAMSSKPGNMKDQLANAILQGSAKERMRRRGGGGAGEAGSRWGKTYWQAASEQSER